MRRRFRFSPSYARRRFRTCRCRDDAIVIDTDLVYLDSTELAALVRSRDISPVEVVAALCGPVGGRVGAPAHWCGVVGFKRSHGLVPLTGHWPDTLQRFMHVGPLARSVRDAALALSLLAGPDGADHYALPVAMPASTIAA